MSEKEKRKEKPKRNSRRFIGLSMVMLLVFLSGMSLSLYYLLKPEPEIWGTPVTNDAIATQNAINLTLISASATAEATTHNTSNARATETMEAAQTLYYVRETITALGDWNWREATATAEAAGTIRPTLSIEAVRLTATALRGWEPYTATPSPNP